MNKSIIILTAIFWMACSGTKGTSSDSGVHSKTSTHVDKQIEMAHPAEGEADGFALKNDSTIFQLGIGLMITGNYEEAEQCFTLLLQQDSQNVALLTNRGVNSVMYGLSLLDETEAEEVIKYVLPFEIAPKLGNKGGDREEALRKQVINVSFNFARQTFAKCVELAPQNLSSQLDHALSLALLARWQDDQNLLQEAYRSMLQTEKLAQEQKQFQTLGYCYLLKGIIYDYLDNKVKRDEYFDLAYRQYEVSPDIRLKSLILRNQAIVDGKNPEFGPQKQEKFNVMEDEPERVDNITLRTVMQGQFRPDETLAELEDAALYRKGYVHSDLFLYYVDVNTYFMFHQTHPDYPATTGKGIKFGVQEAYVKETYGEPTRTLATPGGQFWYYRKAKLIFLIGEEGKVESWMVWRGKKRGGF